MEDYKFCRYCLKKYDGCTIVDNKMSCFQADVDLISLEHESEIKSYKLLLENATDMIEEIQAAVDPVRWCLEELNESMEIQPLINAIKKVDEIFDRY